MQWDRRDPASVKLETSRLESRELAGLEELVGKANVSVDDVHRLRRLGGRSTSDLIARRIRTSLPAPDAVVMPADHEEVLAVLRFCSANSIAAVPYGGGTSVVGGVAPSRGAHASVVALDLCRTASLRALDEISGIATFGAGTTAPQAEELLLPHGLTVGHLPQSFAYATIGGFAATRSVGQASSGHGRFDELVHSLRIATPVGALEVGRAPASAAGPDLRSMFLGSEGAFGVITEVALRVRPIPEVTRYAAWSFPDFASGTEAVRALVQEGVRPTVLRLSDERETRITRLLAGGTSGQGGCLCIATFEGQSEYAADVERATQRTLLARGARSIGPAPALAWERGRFTAPVLRDLLLDSGVMAETIETAALWSSLLALKAAVEAAVCESVRDEGSALVLTHLSHAYPTGASLYFTVLAGLGTDPLGRWRRVKRAASDAILDAGGTITHHHAVGTEHATDLPRELGLLGIDVLRTLKGRLDPAGIMNPGKLLS